jgi:anti-sigma regulatory factor (Ser/Thr protein kinase)
VTLVTPYAASLSVRGLTDRTLVPTEDRTVEGTGVSDEQRGDDTGGGRSHPVVMMLPPDTSSVTQARRGARKVLATWNAEVFEWAASQLVSELAANAVLHAGTPFVVSLSLRGSRLRCEVTDTSSRPPRVRHYSAEASTGRGMRLVEQLSSAWGVIHRPDGKTVWFELDRARGDSRPEPDLDSFALLGDIAGTNVRTGRLDGVLEAAA